MGWPSQAVRFGCLLGGTDFVEEAMFGDELFWQKGWMMKMVFEVRSWMMKNFFEAKNGVLKNFL